MADGGGSFSFFMQYLRYKLYFHFFFSHNKKNSDTDLHHSISSKDCGVIRADLFVSFAMEHQQYNWKTVKLRFCLIWISCWLSVETFFKHRKNDIIVTIITKPTKGDQIFRLDTVRMSSFADDVIQATIICNDIRRIFICILNNRNIS